MFGARKKSAFTTVTGDIEFFFRTKLFKSIGFFLSCWLVLCRFFQMQCACMLCTCSLFIHEQIRLVRPENLWRILWVCVCVCVGVSLCNRPDFYAYYKCKVMANPLKLHTKLPIILTYKNTHAVVRTSSSRVLNRNRSKVVSVILGRYWETAQPNHFNECIDKSQTDRQFECVCVHIFLRK